MKRRDFLKLTTNAAALAVLASTELVGRFKEARAADKKVIQFYANMTDLHLVVDPFNKRGNAQVLYTRISSTQFVATVLAELIAKRLSANILQAPRPIMSLLESHGAFEAYEYNIFDKYPKWAISNKGYISFGIEYVAYIYNNSLVKPQDVPSSYEDLANPKWKDKIVMPNPAVHVSTIQWLIGLKEQVFGSEQAWMHFIKGVAKNRPLIVKSFGPTPAPIESGQVLIGISMPKYIVTKPRAPLSWAPTDHKQPLLGTARSIGIAKESPNPHQTHEFMNYWLSESTMKILTSQIGEYVLYPDVYPPVKGIEKTEVRPVRDLTTEELESWGNKFGKIFGTM